MNASELAKVAEKLPLSESVRKLNLGPEARPSGAETEQQIHKEQIHTHRTRKCRMNKLELRYYEHLKATLFDVDIIPQFRVRVSAWDAPVEVHYTADFMVSQGKFDDTGGRVWYHTLYEVKDMRRKPHSDELTRPKMALEHNRWIAFVVLATWDGSKWTERVIASS